MKSVAHMVTTKPRKRNQGIIGLAAGLQSAEYLASKVAPRKRKRNPAPPLTEWDEVEFSDEELNEAARSGDLGAKAMRSAHAGLKARPKFFTVTWYSPSRKKRTGFIRPIEAHNATDAKRQAKAMVENDPKAANFVAKEIKSNPADGYHVYVKMPSDKKTATFWYRDLEPARKFATSIIKDGGIAYVAPVKKSSKKSNPPRNRIGRNYPKAVELLREQGINFDADYEELSLSDKGLVAQMAKDAGYRAPKSASGSTGRYFYALLQRRYVKRNPRRSWDDAPGKAPKQSQYEGPGYYDDAIALGKKHSKPCIRCGKSVPKARVISLCDACIEKSKRNPRAKSLGQLLAMQLTAQRAQTIATKAMQDYGFDSPQFKAAETAYKKASQRYQREKVRAAEDHYLDTKERLARRNPADQFEISVYWPGHDVARYGAEGAGLKKATQQARSLVRQGALEVVIRNLRTGERTHFEKSGISRSSKRNPSAREMSKRFTGHASGAVAELKAANGAPSNMSRAGKLVFLKLAGTRKALRIPGALVCIDPKKEKLWIAGNRSPLLSKKARVGEVLDFGEIDQICYETAKQHIGGGKQYEYVHSFGEDGGRRPHLHVDSEGMPKIAGGSYKIRAEGIVN